MSAIVNTRISGKLSTNVFNVEDYCASPGASYATNKAALQAALTAANAAGGGKVSITTPGVYKIAGRIVIYSNTEFHVGAGVTIKQETTAIRGENARWLFANNAYVNGANVTISSITSSGRICTVTTSADHNLSVDDYACMYQIATDGYDGVFRIESVPTSTTFTYRANYQLAATPAVASTHPGYTTMVVRKCDTNIHLTGGGIIDCDYLNSPSPATNLDNMGVILAYCQHVSTEVPIINSLKYGLYYSGVRQAMFRNLTGGSLSSTGFQATGPITGLIVENNDLYAADTPIAFGTADYDAYVITSGSVYGVTVRNNVISRGLDIRMYGSSEAKMRGILIENNRGSLNESDIGGVIVVTDAGCLGDGVPYIKDLTVRNTFASSSSSGQHAQIKLSGTVERLIYESTDVQNPTGTASGRVIVITAATIGDIVVNNLKVTNGHSLIDIQSASATINNIFLNNVVSSTYIGINNSANDAFNVFVNNCQLTNALGAFRDASTSGKMTIRLHNSTCSVYLQRTAAQTFVVDGTQMRCDASWVDRTDGVMFYNTNAALGTLGAAGIVVGQGTAANSWHLLADPTLVY